MSAGFIGNMTALCVFVRKCAKLGLARSSYEIAAELTGTIGVTTRKPKCERFLQKR